MYIYINRKLEILSATCCWPQRFSFRVCFILSTPTHLLQVPTVESSQRCNFELKKWAGSFHSDRLWGANCYFGVYLVACFTVPVPVASFTRDPLMLEGVNKNLCRCAHCVCARFFGEQKHGTSRKFATKREKKQRNTQLYCFPGAICDLQTFESCRAGCSSNCLAKWLSHRQLVRKRLWGRLG